MLLLLIFAFLAGIVTILSPCILPILPIVLTGTIAGDKKYPFGVILGFILSFTFFTLFLSTLVKLTGIPADSLRFISVVIVFLFGLSLIIPRFQLFTETLFSRLTSRLPQNQNRSSLKGGVMVGLSLGLLWTPCVGPILASVISLALTGSVTGVAFFITLAYALGTAIPLFAIMYGGRNLLTKIPGLMQNTGKIQKIFGVFMILTAIGIFLNIDRKFQVFVLEKFPQYGVGLTKLEDNDLVKNALNILNPNTSKSNNENLGKPMLDLIEEDLNQAPELIPGGEWFNLPAGRQALYFKNLKGKVVLIDFWTYTCINCIRTLPHLKNWHEKYKDQGLVIIGVHTPEFEFEKNPENVRKAISDFGIKYTVMQDNNYTTWTAYNNRYWPAKYLIDSKGKIRYTHFGEGEYEKTEKIIQDLLKESGVDLKADVTNMPDETPRIKTTPEAYLGSTRMAFFYPSGNIGNGKKTFTLPQNIPTNYFSLGGEWTITDEYSLSGKNAVLELNFYGGKVFLVMRPDEKITNQKVKVILDGKLVNKLNSGVDVKNGIVTLDSDRLYDLIDLRGNPGEHLLRLEFDPGISIFAFTFG